MVSPPAFDDGFQGQQVLSCDGVDILIRLHKLMYLRIRG